MITAIIQARLSSTRFPKKIFVELCHKPLIWHIIDRLKWSKEIQKVVLATTENKADDLLEIWCKNYNINIYRGSENNVLERFYFAAKENKANTIVRITADDPFKDPEIIDKVITLFKNKKLDFAYNNKPPTFPEGLDTEVFSFDALERAYFESTDPFEKEHVTQYFYKNPDKFKQMNYFSTEDLSYLRWTIDTKSDYEMVKIIYDKLYREENVFLMRDILSFLKENPQIELINRNVKRSSMYFRNIM